MTEETQTDPPWTPSLRKSLKEALNKTEGTRCAAECPSCLEDAAVFLAAVLPHMETAYRTGRMAGASASAARLAQKNLELAKKLREVREYAQYHATKCEGWCCDHAPKLLAILGDES